MSEAKLISPMLDGFAIGGPISDHHGIRCYPAMPADSDKRYIVKVISIPASQVQLDALLLAGAYSSKDAALAYFKELADGVAAEVDILKKLSRFEGFIPFEDLQIVPKDDGTGYDVYLLSSYKRSLERHMKKKPMTHLSAVNLGLDLCASMVVCRRKGYLYVDLKPTNIFINEKGEFRIGDLGFQRLDSLRYASLPDKYRSSYTAPEISDAWSSLNDTLDTYAIGMILYQVYNDGKLPFEGQAGSEELPPPLYADYEMAEIILKAIAPRPELRWTDPMLMGQALVAYMQRNTVNDVSIVPLPAAESPAPVEEPAAEPIVSEPDTVAEIATAPETDAQPAENDTSVETDNADDADVEILPGLIMDEDVTLTVADAPAAVQSDANVAQDELTDLSFMDNMVSDDTAPDSDTADSVEYTELSDETSDMLALADELIALEMPEPVVAPEPIDVPIPAPIVLEDPVDKSEDITVTPVVPVPADEPALPEAVPAADAVEAETEESQESDINDAHGDEDLSEEDERPTRWKGIVAAILILALLAACAFGGYYYYKHYYLQTVNALQFDGDANNLVVIVDSEADESLLTVVCTDTYGTTRTAPVVNGKAVFENLNPDTIYQVTVVIDGFHELQGDITDDYTTPAPTNIVRFDAIAGNDESSVVLNFTVDGKDSDTWTITYSADGEQAKSVTFAGHLATITGLAPNKEYTFTLSGSDSMYIVGNDTVTFTTSALVYATDLTITSCDQNGLTTVWSVPEGTTVESWTVRCYNDKGYDKTMTVTEMTCTFDDIDPYNGYTVEVIAKGMSVGTRTYVSASSTTITAFQYDASVPMELTVSWEFSGPAPKDGWLVLYKLQDSEQQGVMKVTENQITLTNAMPGGTYDFTVQASDGSTIFGGEFSCSTEYVKLFSGYGVSQEDMTIYMIPTPRAENWTANNVNLYRDPTTTYSVGDKISLLIAMDDDNFQNSNDVITALLVVRDMNGDLVCRSSVEYSWVYMWHEMYGKKYCALDVLSVPTEPGSYYLNIYFNNMAISQLHFTITE